jgi:hypothetical protein
MSRGRKAEPESREPSPAIVFMTPFESSPLRFQSQAVWSAAVSHSGRSAAFARLA